MDLDVTLGAADAEQAALPKTIGRYAIKGELGRGAMRVVLLARDTALDRDVAIKLLLAAEDRLQRLRGEAQTMARLSHPNVVAVHDVGDHDGRTFVAMERVVGGTLRSWLLHRQRHVVEILDVFAQAGDGLAAAHGAGLVHRDFKPDNVLVGHDGRVRVSDFGLASRSRGAVDGTWAHAGSGEVVGTPAYMSPEQLMGSSTGRSDQFSFCVALFEALTGTAPYAGPTLATRYEAIRTGAVAAFPAAAQVPEAVAAVIRRGLSHDPEARFPTMDLLLATLRAARRGTGVGVSPAERADALWAAGARAAILARFEATGLPYVARTIRSVCVRLDQHVATWRAAAEEAIAMAAEDPFYYADAAAHVERALQEVAGFVRLLEHIEPEDFASAYRGTLPLRPLLEYRLSDDAPVSSPRPPRDPSRRRAAELLRGQVLRAALLSQTRRQEALELARDAKRRSEELGDLPTLAEALVILGMTGVTSGAATEFGIDALERARDVAGRCGHALAGAQAALELARALTGLGAGAPTAIADDGRATALITEARTLSAQLGRPLRVEVELANVESAVLLRSGARAGAVAVLTAALAQVEDHHGLDSPERVPLLIRRAAMRAELGESKGATEDAGAAAVVLRSTLGPGHLGLAQCLDFHGHFLLVSGRLDEAHAVYDEVASLLDSAPRADPLRRLWCDNKRGQIALARRDLGAARRWFDVALTGFRAAPGPLHWYAVYGPIDLLALTEWLDGRFDDAERHADELIERSLGMVPPPLYGRYVRAELWARAGRTAEAHALLDTIAESGGVPVGMSDGLAMSIDVWRARVWAHEGRLADAEATLERAIGAASPERPIGDLEARADHARVRLLLGDTSAPEEVRAITREVSGRGFPLTTPLRMALGGC